MGGVGRAGETPASTRLAGWTTSLNHVAKDCNAVESLELTLDSCLDTVLRSLVSIKLFHLPTELLEKSLPIAQFQKLLVQKA